MVYLLETAIFPEKTKNLAIRMAKEAEAKTLVKARHPDPGRRLSMELTRRRKSA